MKIVYKYRIYKINFWHLKEELYDVSDGSVCDPLKNAFLYGTMWHYALRNYWQPIIKSIIWFENFTVSHEISILSHFISIKYKKVSKHLIPCCYYIMAVIDMFINGKLLSIACKIIHRPRWKSNFLMMNQFSFYVITSLTDSTQMKWNHTRY